MKLFEILNTSDSNVSIEQWKERIERHKQDMKREKNPKVLSAMKDELERKKQNLKKALKENGVLNVPTMTPEQLADHHSVPLSQIQAAIKQGVKIEQEHTKDLKIANEIARDHIKEDPKYYDKLEKIEKKPLKENLDFLMTLPLNKFLKNLEHFFHAERSDDDKDLSPYVSIPLKFYTDKRSAKNPSEFVKELYNDVRRHSIEEQIYKLAHKRGIVDHYGRITDEYGFNEIADDVYGSDKRNPKHYDLLARERLIDLISDKEASVNPAIAPDMQSDIGRAWRKDPYEEIPKGVNLPDMWKRLSKK